jgi:hypothetical protein
MSFSRVALIVRHSLFAIVVVCSLNAQRTHAQEPLRVALFKTAADDGSLTDLAAALDPVVGSELGEVWTVQIASRPALDLPSMQLAIDCVGETADCLNAAARQADADSLLAPSITRDGEAIVVTFLHFDPHARSPHTVQRHYSGARIGEQVLSGVEDMLVELFGTNPPASNPSSGAAASSGTEEAPAAPPPPAAKPADEDSVGIPVLPIVIGGLGVVLIGTGTALGVMSKSSKDAYLRIHPENEREADVAMDHYYAARTEAITADIALGLGTAALIGAGVLLYWHLKDRGDRPAESSIALTPQIGRREVGLTLTAAWNDSL